jgi:hypothetical protein
MKFTHTLSVFMTAARLCYRHFLRFLIFTGFIFHSTVHFPQQNDDYPSTGFIKYTRRAATAAIRQT